MKRVLPVLLALFLGSSAYAQAPGGNAVAPTPANAGQSVPVAVPDSGSNAPSAGSAEPGSGSATNGNNQATSGSAGTGSGSAATSNAPAPAAAKGPQPKAWYDVLADKPMVRTPADLVKLEATFKAAKAKHVLLYDIMTERSEITTRLQRELSMLPGLFGTLEKGTPANPAVSEASVHYFSKIVAGVPLKRPEWFFDVRQEGEGIVDVSTHLVDLVQWEAFPNKAVDRSDVTMLKARRWATPLTLTQFSQLTGASAFPAYLKRDVRNGVLHVFSNGEMTYRVKGVVAHVSVTWVYEAPEGSGDTHFSVMRGTKARLVIRQGAAQDYQPALYIERNPSVPAQKFDAAVLAALMTLQERFSGIGVRREGDVWAVTIPGSYDVGHEAHFAEVTNRFLDYLRGGEMPEWEVPNMLTKYATIMKAYTMSGGH
jgi:predicted dehydrogenase